MKICENVYWYREKGWMDANTFVIKGDITVLIAVSYTHLTLPTTERV